jgi:glycosyltransferase involved in cell wall biosynthesis
MPRKRLPDAELVIAAVASKLERAGWRLDAVDGVEEREVAARLIAADIFMAFGEREGFGLPVAEAMASGAACIGFTGVGGGEVLTARTGWPVPEADVVTYTEELLSLVDAVDRADPEVGQRTAAGRRLVEEQYTRDRERASALAAFGALLP